MPSVLQVSRNPRELSPRPLRARSPAPAHRALRWGLGTAATVAIAGSLCACIPPPPPEEDAAIADAGVTCKVIAPTDCPEPRLRYTTNIEPIIKARCVPCHDGRGPQWPLKTYGDVADWSDQVASMVGTCTMPPPDAGMSLPTAERATILTWIHCGYPE